MSILDPQAGLSAEDRFVMEILDRFVRQCKKHGMSGTEALQRMAFQATVGVFELGKQLGGHSLGKADAKHLFEQLLKTFKLRGLTFVYQLVDLQDPNPRPEFDPPKTNDHANVE